MAHEIVGSSLRLVATNNKEYEDYCRKCETSQFFGNKLPELPVMPNAWPRRPWDRLHVDLAGPLAGSYLLVVVDAFSKWMEVRVLGSITADTVINHIHQIFATLGFPSTVVSDTGSQLTSQQFQSFCSSHGVRSVFVSPYHPRSNCLAEKAVQTCKNAVTKLMYEGMHLQDAVLLFWRDIILRYHRLRIERQLLRRVTILVCTYIYFYFSFK